MNAYAESIVNGLKVDEEEAIKIQNFINNWFDDFRWSSATNSQIVRTAKQAQAMIADPRYAELVAYNGN